MHCDPGREVETALSAEGGRGMLGRPPLGHKGGSGHGDCRQIVDQATRPPRAGCDGLPRDGS